MFPLLAGRDEAGALIRAHDWAATPLGPVEGWSPALRILSATVLGGALPMVLLWGRDLLMLYNDAYRPLLGDRTDALGKPVSEAGPEVQAVLAPLMERALAGEACRFENAPVRLLRRSTPEEAFFDFALSPVFDERGAVAGVLHVGLETTSRVTAERRQAFRLALEEQLRDVADPAEVIATVSEALGRYLRAGQVSYAEIEPGGATALIGCEWNDGTMASNTGRHRLDDYGPELIAALKRGETVAVADVRLDPRTSSAGALASFAHASISAFLNVPIVKAGRLAAILGVHNATSRSWSAEEIALATDIADRTWAAAERVRAEAAQRESEARFRAALEIETVGVIYFDMEGRLTEANDAFLRMGGYSREDLERGWLTWQKLTPDEWLDISNRAFAELKETGRTTPYEKQYVRKDGTRWWALFAAKLLPDGTGFEFVVDITERKQADQRRLALVELSDRIRDARDPEDLAYAAAEILGRVLRVSRVGYGSIDVAAETVTVRRDWNAPGVVSLAGFHRFADYGSFFEEMRRGEAVVITDVTTDPRTAATPDGLMAAGVRSLVNMAVTEQGGLVALLYLNHATARVWSDDELALIREVAERTRTAVERLRAEADLRESEARLRQLNETLEAQVIERTAERDHMWDTSPDLMLVIDFDGVFRRVNPAWTAILGYAPEELVGHHVNEFVIAEDHRQTTNAYEHASRGGKPAIENRYRHKDGSLRCISWVAAPDGDVTYAVGRDVTAEKGRQAALEATQAQLHQAQKMEAIGQLTGGLAHDVNNMLQGIGGALQLAEKRIAAGRLDDLPRLFRGAREGVERAAALTHGLLAFARRGRLDPEPIVVDEVVRGMAELVRRTVGPAIEVHLRLNESDWTTSLDRSRLESALLNLAINARDAMPEGGCLTFSTHETTLSAAELAKGTENVAPGDFVLVSVADTGAGMPRDVLARVFEPFFTTKPIGSGTGLGLSQLYGFVRQSGGLVRIESEVGRGTTVRLYLPRGEALPSVAGHPEPRAAPADASGCTVLLIDDEPEVRSTAAEALRDRGYRVLEAGDGPSGLATLAGATEVDILVTDVGLPGLNGRQVADAARERRPSLPVLFITGYAGTALDRGLPPGMAAIGKPFSLDRLVERVATMLAERGADGLRRPGRQDP